MRKNAKKMKKKQKKMKTKTKKFCINQTTVYRIEASVELGKLKKSLYHVWQSLAWG